MTTATRSKRWCVERLANCALHACHASPWMGATHGESRMQVERAVETEINTGPAPAPHPTAAAVEASNGGATASAGDAMGQQPQAQAQAQPSQQQGQEAEEEYDPLEAFMAEINQDIAAADARKQQEEEQQQQQQQQGDGARPNPKPRKRTADLSLDEQYDPGVEFMEARQAARRAGGAASIAAAVAAQGYDSDEEVYATARALEEAGGGEGREYDVDDNPLVSCCWGFALPHACLWCEAERIDGCACLGLCIGLQLLRQPVPPASTLHKPFKQHTHVRRCLLRPFPASFHDNTTHNTTSSVPSATHARTQVERRRDIAPLAALDHSAVAYEPVAKDFYEESADIAAMSDAEVSWGVFLSVCAFRHSCRA